MAGKYLKRIEDNAVFLWSAPLAAKKHQFVEISEAEAKKLVCAPKPEKPKEESEPKTAKEEFAGWSKEQLIEYAAEKLAFDLSPDTKKQDMIKQIMEAREEAALIKMLS